MAESLVTDWIADYSSLDASEIRTFAAQHEHNHEIASALFSILNERHKYTDVSFPRQNRENPSFSLRTLYQIPLLSCQNFAL